MSSPIIFAGRSHPELAQKICQYIDGEPGRIEIGKNSDDELEINFAGRVANRHAVIVQTNRAPVAEHLHEVNLIVDRLRLARVARVTLVIPHMFHSHGVKEKPPHTCAGLRTVGNIWKGLGVDAVITVHMHAPQIVPFFPVPLINLPAVPLLCHHLREHNDLTNIVLVASHVTDGQDVARYANYLKIDLALIDRRKDGSMELLCRSVRGKHCIIVDDMIRTGATTLHSARFLMEEGAKDVRIMATHGVFCGEEHLVHNLRQAPLQEIVVTNTLPLHLPKEIEADIDAGNVRFVSIDFSQYIAAALSRSHNGDLIDPLWEDKDNLSLIRVK